MNGSLKYSALFLTAQLIFSISTLLKQGGLLFTQVCSWFHDIISGMRFHCRKIMICFACHSCFVKPRF